MSDLLGDARHLPPSAQKFCGRGRWPRWWQGETARTLRRVSLKAVDNWWAKWQAGGRDALLARPKGRPVGVHQVLGEAEQAAASQAVLDIGRAMSAW
ncbi:helix-turn-helix domain-containing protein [Streptomyces sp. NBC_00211]|uniref:helix-turn-helix domain-containing protein n=1 Tax=Streptomyces sp. NBC_00211 TaxID=2975683 RepID=UPI00324B0CBE